MAALLDTNTHNPLIATPIGLTQTDSFLNLQAGGTSYLSPKVLISGTNLNNKRIVSVDISQLTPGTSATLYFDLLGFGAKDSHVSIDDIHLITNDQQPPIANNDIGTTNQGQAITLNVLNNDSAPNGTIDPTTVQLSTIPQGTVIINPQGTLTYTPKDGFVGSDSLTYTVTDNQGIISNQATVNITVNNLPPHIVSVEKETQILEGTSTLLKATATEAR